MKITYLVPNIDGMGGTSRAVLTQAHALRGHHEIEILSVFQTSEHPHYETPEGVRVRYLSSSVPGAHAKTFPASLLDSEMADTLISRPSILIPEAWDPTLNALSDPALEHALPRLRSDILVTVTPGLLAAAAQLVSDRVGLVHQEHRASSERTAGMEPLLAFGPRADAIILLTRDNAEWLEAKLDGSSPIVGVIPNALPPGYRPRSAGTNPLIVSAGRFVKEKQFTHLIRAFSQIADQIPEWRLRIYGSGPNQPRMTRMVRKCRLFDRVELPGNSHTMQLDWANASIAALTSRSEGLPLIVQEAMAAGVPVASYDCPSGPRELIEHDKTGLLVPPGSETGMAEALLQLATDEPRRQAMGAAALEASARYEPSRIAAQWDSLFNRVIESRRSVGSLPRATGRVIAAARSTNSAPMDVADGSHKYTHRTTTPTEARIEALQLAINSATEATRGWFVLPGSGTKPPTVVVPHLAREGFFESLAQRAPQHLCLRRPESPAWPEKVGTVVAMSPELTRTVTESVSLEPWTDPDAPGLLGQGCGVMVEFWIVRDQQLMPPRESSFNKPVPLGPVTVDREVNGVTVPTLANLSVPAVDQCLFPVDAVVTWVDGSDVAWSEKRLQRLAEFSDGAVDRSAGGRARYADNGELRYALRSIDLFAPWIQKIHLVTAGQIPKWLDPDHPRIQLVDHAEILPGDALPTFNSHAIETALHRVPGLSEQYIYFNDDVFLARPVAPELFFSPDGRPAMFPSKECIGPDNPDAPAYLQAAYNNRRLLERDLGRTITHTLAHTPHPQSRMLVAEVVARYSTALDRTARSAFRSATDVSLTSSLSQHYGIITGKSWRGAIDHTLVNRSSPRLRAELAALSRRDLDTFCIADQHDYGTPKHKADVIMSTFFEDYFPVRSSWEID